MSTNLYNSCSIRFSIETLNIFVRRNKSLRNVGDRQKKKPHGDEPFDNNFLLDLGIRRVSHTFKTIDFVCQT